MDGRREGFEGRVCICGSGLHRCTASSSPCGWGLGLKGKLLSHTFLIDLADARHLELRVQT